MASKHFFLTALFLCTSINDAIGKVYDLSHVHKPSTFVFPDVAPYNRTTVFQGELWKGIYVSHGYYTTGEHSGTHMDAPAHFIQGGKTLDEITVDMSIAEGVMIDCVQEARETQNYSVPISKLLEWERANGQIPFDAAVLFNFGWSAKFEDIDAYKGSTTDYHFPYISEEAGLWLFNQRRLKIIGSDTFSPDSMDPVNGNHNIIHRTLLGHDKLIMENLKGLDQLPPRGFRFYGTPVKYLGSTGTQIRAFAISMDEDSFSSASWTAPSMALSCLATVFATALL